MPKNQWARTPVDPNGQYPFRRVNTCKTEKQVKRGHRRWSGGGEPPMLKLAENTTVWEQEHGFRESRSEKRVNTLV